MTEREHQRTQERSYESAVAVKRMYVSIISVSICVFVCSSEMFKESVPFQWHQCRGRGCYNSPMVSLNSCVSAFAGILAGQPKARGTLVLASSLLPLSILHRYLICLLSFFRQIKMNRVSTGHWWKYKTRPTSRKTDRERDRRSAQDSTVLPNMWLVGTNNARLIHSSNWLAVWSRSSHWLVGMVSQSNSGVIQRVKEKTHQGATAFQVKASCVVLLFTIFLLLYISSNYFFTTMRMRKNALNLESAGTEWTMTELQPKWLAAIINRRVKRL